MYVIMCMCYICVDDMLVAGTDTTGVTITWGFLQISTKAEVQKKIQQEIDAFVDKNGRLPYFWERDSVPYMIAVQRECFRLRPTTEFGVPHAVTEDCKFFTERENSKLFLFYLFTKKTIICTCLVEWRGTLIPKKTWILANMMEAHMDPEKYPNPEQFSPERFLRQKDTMSSSANRKYKDRDQFNFGWGR